MQQLLFSMQEIREYIEEKLENHFFLSLLMFLVIRPLCSLLFLGLFVSGIVYPISYFFDLI